MEIDFLFFVRIKHYEPLCGNCSADDELCLKRVTSVCISSALWKILWSCIIILTSSVEFDKLLQSKSLIYSTALNPCGARTVVGDIIVCNDTWVRMSLRCPVIISKSELIRLEMNDRIAYEYPAKQRLLYQNAGKREDFSNSMVLKKRQYGTCPHCKNILENRIE